VVSDSLFESVPNFSEGRDQETVTAIVAGARGAHVLDADADPDHNRTVISLAGFGPNLLDGVFQSVQVAVERIDISRHRGVHPRVGAADVVPIVPLDGAPLARCRELAHQLGERIWNELHVPVYFYGEGQSLADIRAGRGILSLGGPGLHPTAGAACVGARQKLVAFNVILPGIDAGTARALARSLRESAGGMRGVQALVFELPDGRVQLSMNLFRLQETPPGAVIAELSRRRVAIGPQQVIGLCPAAATFPAAAGRLLEARLGASAARAGAQRCANRGGEEHLALSRRLANEAVSLAGLGIDQVELLGGAERSAALVPVLAAAGVLDLELRAMLAAAAGGLRNALAPETISAHVARIAALDRRLQSPSGE
jgi:glutamate formiminotransferase